MSDDVRYYATPGSMTALSGFDQPLTGMPTDPIGVAAGVRGSQICHMSGGLVL
jgi:hypothetical protein